MKKVILYLLAITPLFFGCNTQKAKDTNGTVKNIDASQKVFLITLDGLRWQELFTGADSLLINNTTYTKDTSYLKAKYWKKESVERRTTLLPFFWNSIAKKGQLYGNRTYNNKVNVANTHWFSYPGYSEILCGYADNDRINSNDKKNNPNQTILELTNNLPAYKGKVGAFGSWDVFPYIINEERSKIYVNAGYKEAIGDNLTAKENYLNQLQKQAIQPWSSVRQDVFTHNYALEFIKKEKPKLMYISYGETDDFAHDGDYTHYLLAAENTDAMIQQLWNYCQSNPFYKGKTTFIITTDHGRGTEPLESWKSHGLNLTYHGKTYNINGSDETWLAVIGPNVSSKGEVKTEAQLYNNQIAATIQDILQIKVLGSKANQKVLPILER
ncbi:lipoprotein precursor [Tenacibaculum sp. 190524A02b]|uniref:phosphoglyceromutase n=1 Tax=Tenacibaculum vairaonense TaxID=3137860 RepID=UPI0032B22DBB